MFGLFTRRPKVARPAKTASHRTRLALEHLETRDCPAAPVINSLSVAPLAGHNVSVNGTVSDAHPESVYLQFSGVISGTTFPDASGNFSLLAMGDVPGVIDAKGVNDQCLWSNTVSATLTVPKPTVTLTVLPGIGRNVILMGSVGDLDATSLQVNFTGAVTGSASVGLGGAYTLVTGDATLGQVQATTTNLWGLTSDPATGEVTNRAPVFTSFSAVREFGGMFTLKGTVSDESPIGMKVTFSGTASVNGMSAWVSGDGSFSAFVMVAPGETGTVTANTTDCWGAAAAPVSSLLI